MKYVVVIVMDQTIGFLTDKNKWTVKHHEARLFDVSTEAENEAFKFANDGSWVEEIEDIDEFKSRKDTW